MSAPACKSSIRSPARLVGAGHAEALGAGEGRGRRAAFAAEHEASLLAATDCETPTECPRTHAHSHSRRMPDVVPHHVPCARVDDRTCNSRGLACTCGRMLLVPGVGVEGGAAGGGGEKGVSCLLVRSAVLENVFSHVRLEEDRRMRVYSVALDDLDVVEGCSGTVAGGVCVCVRVRLRLALCLCVCVSV